MSRILFHLTVVSATAFVITILASVAILLGDPVAPFNVWFSRHGTTVLIIEAAVIVVLGLAAMTADGREMRRAKSTAGSADPPSQNPI